MTGKSDAKRLSDDRLYRIAEHDRMLLAAALEQAEETVAIADIDGTVSYVNPAFQRLTGFSSDTVVGQRLDVVFKELAEDSILEEKWEAISKGEPWHGRIRRRKQNGEIYEVAASITPILDSESDRRVTAYVIVERDLTNEVRMEKQMRQSQKMEALGTLAGGIAHDLNNILMPIVLNAELMLEQLPPDSPYRSSLEKVLNAAHRGRDLVKQVVTFSRRGGQERVPLLLTPLIKEALALFRASLPADIEVVRQLAPVSKMVAANPSQIHQVLLNLCSNAADAIGGQRGRVTVCLEEVVLDKRHAGHLSLRSGLYLRLSVSDDGCGMQPDVLHRIFEPFFTTKGPGEGTGMGLATVHGIVTQHGGAVDVTSQPGIGSTFHVYFPGQETSDPMAGPVDDDIPGGSGHILVVDDDEVIAETLSRVLERLGYSVTPVSDPLAAVERFAASPESFDLVLTDQTMAGLRGIALAERIHARDATTPIVLCTGHIDYVDRDVLKQRGVKAVMMKPVTRGELARAVSRAIQSAQKERGIDG